MPIAPYLKPIAQRLGEKIERDGPLREDYITTQEILSLVMNSRSLQLFFLEFLQGNLPMIALQAQNEIKDKGYAVDKMIADMRKNNRFLDEVPITSARPADVFPMTVQQFEQAAKAIQSESIQAVAAILQMGMTDYFTEIQDLLATSFGLVNISAAQKSLSRGIRANSMWRELMFFMGASQSNGHGFTDTFEQAKQNGFHSHDFTLGTVEVIRCPAQHIIRHLCAMDFGKDGEKLVPKSPRPGALLDFIAREWAEQKARQASLLAHPPQKSAALTAG